MTYTYSFCFGYPISKNHSLLYHSINDNHIEQFIYTLNNNKQFQYKLFKELPNIINIDYNTTFKHNCNEYRCNIWDVFDIHKKYYEYDIQLNQYIIKKLITYINQYNINIPTKFINKISDKSIDSVTQAYGLVLLYMIICNKNLSNKGGGKDVNTKIIKAIVMNDEIDRMFYIVNILNNTGEIKSIVLKITTDTTPNFGGYIYEAMVYNELTKSGRYDNTHILKYYGHYIGKIKKGFIREHIKLEGIGYVKINVRLTNKLLKDTSKRYSMLITESITDTHMTINDYLQDKWGNVARGIIDEDDYDNIAKYIFIKIGKIMSKLNKMFGFVHGDFHDNNCFISNNGKNIIIIDFDFSLILGKLISPHIFNYDVINEGYKMMIKNFKKLKSDEQTTVLIHLYIIDMIRMYHHMRIFGNWRNNISQINKYSPLILSINNDQFDIQKMITNAYNNQTIKEKLKYNETNDYLMSLEYYDKIFQIKK
jgi:hypothetical protein